MAASETSPLISTEWLERHIDDPELRIVDVRWRSRYEKDRGLSLDDYEGYLNGHIPGALFVGMANELSDPDHPIPDMLAPPEAFAETMGRLGIGDDTLVVAYDDMGIPLGSARLWWALSYYGHERVRVLDGGLRQWRLEGRPLTSEVPEVKPARFTPRPRPAWIADKEQVKAALEGSDAVIIDCLSPDLFRGEGGRHLWGERPGHIPGAVNVPAVANLDPELANLTAAERQSLLSSDRPLTFQDPKVLAALYAAAGVTPDRPVITYCGRGYAAACGLLALKVIGQEQVRLYDGSWTEWSADPDLPVES